MGSVSTGRDRSKDGNESKGRELHGEIEACKRDEALTLTKCETNARENLAFMLKVSPQMDEIFRKKTEISDF